MAGELASAVALQSQPYNRPQSTGVSEAALDNAFNGRRRADEERKRKEDAEKDKRLDSIMKNSVFTKRYENDYFNRQYQQQITKAMDEVLQAYESGDENVGVVGARAVNKLQQINQTLYSADKSMSAAQKAYDKDPNSLGIYNDQQTIGGKPFSNVFQAINSGDNDSLMPNVAEQYWSTGTEIMERDIAGEKIWVPQFVPGGAVTTDPFSLIEKDVNNPDNATWLNPVPKTYKLGDTTVQSHEFQIEPTVAEKLAAQGMSTPESINYILDQDYRYRKQAAEKNGMTWTRKEQASLTPKENAETIKRYAEELTSKIHGRVGRRERIQDSPPAPKESASAKAAAAAAGQGGYDETGTIWSVPVLDKASKKAATPLVEGTIVETNGKPAEKVTSEIVIEATPIQFVWGGSPEKSYFHYQSYLNKEGKSLKGINVTYDYKVPLTRTSARNYAAAQDTKWTDLAPRLFDGVKAGQIADIQKFLTSLGMDSTIPPSGSTPPKAAAAKSPAKTGIPLINNKAEFDALPKGAEYTKADGKTYKKA